jgi:hypothetical protein
MYTSPLVIIQPMRRVSLLFGLIIFVWSSVFRFMHHKPKNRGHMLTTKNVQFVKLLKCVTDFTIMFLLSRWSKNIYGTFNLESGWESYASEKIYELPVLPVRDHRYYQSEKVLRRYELPVLPVRDRYYRWMAEGGAVWREYELPILPVRDQYYR